MIEPERPRRRAVELPGRGPGALSFLEHGPPDAPVELIFLHATGFNALTYRHIAGPLAELGRVLILDQRGHGLTTLTADPKGRVDWLDFRDDLIAFCHALGLEGAVLSGHSMGGTVAVLAAAETAAIARRLVLFEPVAHLVETASSAAIEKSSLVQGALRRRAVFPSRQVALSAYAGRGAFASWPRAILVDYIEGGFLDLPTGEVTLACSPAWESAIFAFQAHDTWGAFAAARMPIEILAAERDSTFRVGDRLGEFVASGRVRIETVADTSHFLPMERPAFVRAALTAAIGERPPPAA